MVTTKEKQSTTHSFDAEISKVLHLMINALYTNKDIFLRELISNASDACDKLQYEARSDDSLLKDDPELKIRLEIDKKNRLLTITDNGIGMNEQDMVANLGTIARSGTQEFVKQLTGDKSTDVNLIGQFGVGFYSAFMVADHVTVTSRKAGEEKGYVWRSDGEGEYTVEPAKGDVPRGTRIELHLREEEDIYLDRFRIEHVVQTYSDHIPYPIEMQEEEGEEWKILNKASALWARPKSEVNEEEYQQFYKHVSNMPDKPWMTLHNKVEGALEYTSLLYIPSMRPFDLFHPDRMRRVKLYVKRVFITEEHADLIPHYLRFLRGVVDSEDLPLNISRETLQHNRLLEKIKTSLTKRVFGELKKKAKNDREAYETFWENFGSVIKEGLCEAASNKEQILETCLFYSANQPDKLITLDEYMDKMPEGQDQIYYLIGDDVEVMKNSPQLEGFLKRGYDVLLFPDHVDTFWVNVVNQYKEKPILSVTKAQLDDETDAEDADSDESKAEEKQQAKAAIDQLIAKLKDIYGEEVKDVRITRKLSESPVCLAVGAGDMDIRMERFLVENNQLPGISARILELNPDHAVIKQMASMAQKNAEDEIFLDGAMMLLDQARIIEGEEVKNPSDFARRMTAFMAKGLS